MSPTDASENELPQLDEIGTREEWLDVPGVDFDADQSGVLDISIRAESEALHVTGERDEANVDIHTDNDERVFIAVYSDEDDVAASFHLTASEAGRIAQQLRVAAKAATERGSTDVRT